jgi:branched-chain amino acid transport system ATP-binding protein
MLRVERLETAYGLSQVLFGVSFAVRPGEVATLLGRNGMGKTTTVLSVMGVVASRAGSVALEGRELRGLPSYRIAQAGIGLVPEGRQVFPNLTVRENLVATAANRSRRASPWDSNSFPSSPSAAAITATSSRAASSRCSRSGGP